MNELSTQVQDAPTTETGMSLMMLDANRMRALIDFSELMANAVVTVPKHLVGKPADCLAIAMQAAQWGMNPFGVAQKTHLVNGTLGYEAQLVNAVITSSGAINGHFHYEYRGSGQDLECRVGAVLRGETEIVWGEWLRNGDVKTRNSPLWAVNPKQQLGYLQVKNFARLYCPGAILGVYTDDELGGSTDAQPEPAKTGPQRRSAQQGPLEVVERVDQMTGEVEPAAAAPLAEAPAPTAAAASSPAAAPANGAGISGGQVAYLRNKLKAAGVAEASICDRFQVTAIELLTVDAFDTVKAELLANA